MHVGPVFEKADLDNLLVYDSPFFWMIMCNLNMQVARINHPWKVKLFETDVWYF